jgi:hypothetical protein
MDPVLSRTGAHGVRCVIVASNRAIRQASKCHHGIRRLPKRPRRVTGCITPCPQRPSRARRVSWNRRSRSRRAPCAWHASCSSGLSAPAAAGSERAGGDPMRMPALLDTQRAKVAALAVTLGVVAALHSIVPVGTRSRGERVAELAVRAAARMGWSGEPLESLRLAASPRRSGPPSSSASSATRRSRRRSCAPSRERTRPLSRAQGASARPRTCAAVGHAHPSKPA